MAFQSTHYQRVISSDDDGQDEDLPPVIVTTRGGEERGRWSHLENLDEFFTRVYHYHRHQGFVCMVVKETLQLVQYLFIVLFTTFLVLCINYELLFESPNPVLSKVVHFHKIKSMPPGMAVCLVVAFLFWWIRVFRVISLLIKAWEIKQFYCTALKIAENDLQNMQWHDVQKRLVEAQTVHMMCIHKAELTELDIYNRILRRKNYLVAMQNKAILPCIFKFPFLGHRTFLTEGLKYNLNLVLFNGPGAPFESDWKLRSEYKDHSNRMHLASALSKRIFFLGIINLALAPFVLIWEILYSFFRYTELIKRAPDTFGARRWSPYGRLYLRHFNELDHEFHSRLSKAYDPAAQYTNSFSSPLVTILAKNIAFFASAILAVLLGLSFYDRDVLTAEHVISVIATLGLMIRICAAFIPSEHMVWCPRDLMKKILMHTHYIPDHWKEKAHTSEVRDQFSRLFQYKFIYLIEELLSPILTPLILCWSIRYKALDIVDFYRNFTVEVVGVGDVCSFGQLNIRKHGNPEWLINGQTDADVRQRAENGKTELSLLHFSIKNPTWRPSGPEELFISTVAEQIERESLAMSGSVPLTSSRDQQEQQQPLEGVWSSNMQGVSASLKPLHLPDLQNEIGKSGITADDVTMTNSIMFLHQARDRRLHQSDIPPSPQTQHPPLVSLGEIKSVWPDVEDEDEEEEEETILSSQHSPRQNESKF